ncbi:MAG: glutamate--tRNA ligase [Planctomycetes bacterium]|nr:glutamate--tRNA ligase [Planctomycetota bacterium]
MTVRLRIAPSPTGDPHVGTAYIALFNLAFARRHGGRFVLRIEDTDRARSTPESERMISESLRWLGLLWDEGPDVGGPNGPYRQSERGALYRKYADELLEKGAAYRCFCSAERLDQVRKAQEAAKHQPRYDGKCRILPRAEAEARVAAGEPHVVRLRVPEDGFTSFADLIRGEVRIENRTVDDQVLLKSDGMPTYHLANVVDDRLMGITHVVRAEEWISSTPKHLLLYRAFGWETPQFGHMPLLRNSDRTKISKRKNPTSLKWYEAQGYLPEALVNFLALQGFSVPEGIEIFPFSRVVETFEFSRINTTGPVFDLQKLEWLNGEYIRKLGAEDLAQRLLPFARPGTSLETVRSILPLVQGRLKRLGEFQELTDFFFADRVEYEAGLLVPKKLEPARAVEGLRTFVQAYAAMAAPVATEIDREGRAIAERLGWKVGDLFMMLRVAVTGKTATPPLCETMVALGKDKVAARLDEAVRKLDGLARTAPSPAGQPQ